MRTYITEIKDGHHVVRMLSDKEIEAIKDFIERIKDLWERVRDKVIEIWEAIKDLIESLPEEEKEALLNGTGDNQRTEVHGTHQS